MKEDIYPAAFPPNMGQTVRYFGNNPGDYGYDAGKQSLFDVYRDSPCQLIPKKDFEKMRAQIRDLGFQVEGLKVVNDNLTGYKKLYLDILSKLADCDYKMRTAIRERDVLRTKVEQLKEENDKLKGIPNIL